MKTRLIDDTIQNDSEYDALIRQKADQKKCIFDYLKHFATVSTALVILIPNLINKSADVTRGALVGKVSIILFSITIIASLVAYTVSISSYPLHEQTETRFLKTFGFSLFIAWTSFAAGVIFLSIFSILSIQ